MHGPCSQWRGGNREFPQGAVVVELVPKGNGVVDEGTELAMFVAHTSIAMQVRWGAGGGSTRR